MKPSNMLPAVKSVGSAYAARRGVGLSITGSPGGEHARTRRNVLAGVHGDLPLRPEEHVHARSKFDQAHPLALLHGVSGLLVEYDAARYQSCNLREHHAASITVHRDCILFVLRAGQFFARYQKLAGLIPHGGDLAAHRRAAYVDIENIEEDADAR